MLSGDREGHETVYSGGQSIPERIILLHLDSCFMIPIIISGGGETRGLRDILPFY